jgi:VIT1/CCC1 family predicted Fe2+/Mn2+ transporter
MIMMTKQEYKYAYTGSIMAGSIIGAVVGLFVDDPKAKRVMPLVGALYGAACGIPLLARSVGTHEPYDQT